MVFDQKVGVMQTDHIPEASHAMVLGLNKTNISRLKLKKASLEVGGERDMSLPTVAVGMGCCFDELSLSRSLSPSPLPKCISGRGREPYQPRTR